MQPNDRTKDPVCDVFSDGQWRGTTEKRCVCRAQGSHGGSPAGLC